MAEKSGDASFERAKDLLGLAQETTLQDVIAQVMKGGLELPDEELLLVVCIPFHVYFKLL